MKGYDLKTALFRIKRKIENKKATYSLYLKKEDRSSVDLPQLQYMPRVSLISEWEFENNQLYDNVEIVTGLAEATGDYVAFVNKDMALSETALYYMVGQLVYDDYDLIYADEDMLVNGERVKPFFKPCWSVHTLRSFDYIGFALIRKSLVDDFTDYYSLLLSLSYKDIKVANVERVLVHYKKRERQVNEVSIENNNEKISIIIPSKDNFQVLKRCIDSIREKSLYKNYEIIVVDNGSCDQVKNKVSSLADKYVYEKMEFNFSKMCNIGAKNSIGDFYLFLNDDTEVISENWLDKMLSLARQKQTGAVGCKLLYPDSNKIQHCGVINIKNGPVHPFIGQENEDLYFGRNKYDYNYSAVTGACLMVDKAKFFGFDEDLRVAYNDIDLCLSLVEKGYYNVCANSVSLYHYESLSRGDDSKDNSKLARLYAEREKLYNKHRDFAFRDRFYNRNLSQYKADFSVENPDYVNRGRLGRVVSEPEKFCSDKINYKVEYVVQGDMFSIGGWAYIAEKATKAYVLILTGDNVAVPVEAKPEFRQDISFKTGKNVNLCGFSANIDTGMLENGRYQLGIMLVERLTGKKYVALLDERIDVRVVN